MSSEVKHYWPEEIVGTGELVVYLQDYAALEAENARLQNALLEVTARRFAESWEKRTSDADLEQYLSAGVAQIEAERDALAAELADAAQSLETISRLAGRDEYMQEMYEVRSYAKNRSEVAFDALAAIPVQQTAVQKPVVHACASCAACEGRPASNNNPCYVCGGTVSAVQNQEEGEK